MPSAGCRPRYPSATNEIANRVSISFDIQPSNAEVYVDGQYYGAVSNYTPRSQPLALAPGRHRVEIRAQGRQDMTFDADIQAGQVTPYQGTLAN